jgi:hypothetical protein
MSATSGTVALVHSTAPLTCLTAADCVADGTIKDLVGFGTAVVREGSPATGAGHTASVSRDAAFVKVDRAFPSSQVCSACGFRDGRKPLHVRQWTCGECATVHDRDHNAARNVLFEGRRIVATGRVETSNACGVPVRRAHVPAQRVEAGSRRKGQTTQAGIPGL